MDAGLGGLDRVVLVMDGRCGAGKVVDFVNFDIEGEGDVVAQDFEPVVIHEGKDIVLGAGEKVVNADDVVAIVKEAFAEMGAEEACSAGHGGLFGKESWQLAVFSLQFQDFWSLV